MQSIGQWAVLAAQTGVEPRQSTRICKRGLVSLSQGFHCGAQAFRVYGREAKELWFDRFKEPKQTLWVDL